VLLNLLRTIKSYFSNKRHLRVDLKQLLDTDTDICRCSWNLFIYLCKESIDNCRTFTLFACSH